MMYVIVGVCVCGGSAMSGAGVVRVHVCAVGWCCVVVGWVLMFGGWWWWLVVVGCCVLLKVVVGCG